MSAPLFGFRFPFRITPQGGVASARGFDKVEQDLRHLLSTRIGERVMLRGYGGGLHGRVQEPSDPTLRALIKHEIEQALLRFMPEVRLAGPVRVAAREEQISVFLEYTANPQDAVRRLELRIP